MFPTKLQVNWPFGSGKEAKNRFSIWPPSWISDQNNFNYFYLQVAPMFLPSFKSTGPGCMRSRLLKQIVEAARRTTDTDRSQKLISTILVLTFNKSILLLADVTKYC